MIYRLCRTLGTENYAHLTLELLDTEYRDCQFGAAYNDFEIRWQTDVGSNEWYAGRFHIKAKNYQTLQRALDWAQDLQQANGSPLDPAKMIAELEAGGIREGCYDPRTSRYTTLSELLPADHVRCSALGGRYFVACEKDEEKAQKAMAKLIGAASLEDFEEWILDGKKIVFDEATYTPCGLPVNIEPL